MAGQRPPYASGALCRTWPTSSRAVDTQQFWALIDNARSQVDEPDDAEAAAGRAATLLATLPADQIVPAQQVCYDLMADSYRNPLWAAAYMINGGRCDDGFRGWLITQGRDAFEQVVADPDSLADPFTVRYPEFDPDWDFDFDDSAELTRRLTKLAKLYQD
ncbi:hypothetical protein JOF56_001214 [Kibdelosporangium banguiense]|uniref:DUF4240 domain-containing protein n=1 Tax=Kibdelosporangium banguiense TaxID=1365924 RepID=A0ABS4TA45_9PSEU|nr:DUF4240 domain-containing protein [Kibdelosporangium banguiense]MBP2320829.1 hypothetical protein [Kibdelosporangium banguiense]